MTKSPFELKVPGLELPNLERLAANFTLQPTALPPELARALFNFPGEHLTEVFKQVGEAAGRLERHLKSLEPDARAMGERGWTLPMQMNPWELPRYLRLGSTEALDTAYLAHYSEEGGARSKALFADLVQSADLAHWRPLLRQAIAVYRRRQYLVVVPALLLVLDGAIAALVGALRQRTTAHELAAKKRKEADGSVERLIWLTLDGFLGHVFRAHDFAKDRPLLLNRHWVLHGRDDPAWGRADCLRLFQALHTLAG